MMDTSKEYIAMCDCSEIQGQRPHDNGWRNWGDNGDVVFVREDDDSLDNAHSAGVHVIWNGLIPNGGYHNWRENWAAVADVDVVWIPRQDQLQEMLGKHEAWWLAFSFYKFSNPDSFCVHAEHDDGFYAPVPCQDCVDRHVWIFDTYKSMEQLWLAFVMYEKYGKEWNGTEWAQTC